jgi:uncharacterized membrane protein
MKNWKTTLTGLVTAIAVIAKSVFNIDVPTEAIITVGLFVIAFFAKDSDVTGGTK